MKAKRREEGEERGAFLPARAACRTSSSRMPSERRAFGSRRFRAAEQPVKENITAQ